MVVYRGFCLGRSVSNLLQNMANYSNHIRNICFRLGVFLVVDV